MTCVRCHDPQSDHGFHDGRTWCRRSWCDCPAFVAAGTAQGRWWTLYYWLGAVVWTIVAYAGAPFRWLRLRFVGDD